MELLFITKYLHNDFVGIIKEMHIVLVAFIAVFGAMALDFVFGVRAAKRRGEARTSYGFRRSTLKFLEYYACMLIAFIVDVIASISESINLPYITFFVALILVGIEAYSIWENLQNKKLKSIDKDDLKTLLTLVAHRGDILNAAIKAAQDKLDKTETEKLNNEEKEVGNEKDR